jgi:hypothetical protein
MASEASAVCHCQAEGRVNSDGVVYGARKQDAGAVHAAFSEHV